MSVAEKYLYPPTEPFNSGYLEVSGIHSIYFEECGNKNGNPVVFLHGGPGAACTERDRRHFDPNAYRIILFDQRGAGRSRPSMTLENIQTERILEDMEKLREHLGVDRWIVFGGSWDSTLALLYAGAHVDKVKALIMHGIFTARPSELSWLYSDSGAALLHPDLWEDVVKRVPNKSPDSLVINDYLEKLLDTQVTLQEKADLAKTMASYDKACSRRNFDPAYITKFDKLHDPEKLQDLVKGATFALHYFVNGFFLRSPNQVMDCAEVIKAKNIPVTIVQGRFDTVCPAATAWELYRKLGHENGHVNFDMVDDGGHSNKEENYITRRLVEACDRYKNL